VTELVLFDMDPEQPREPEPQLSAGRRRTIRQAQALEHGQHPLGLVHGTYLRLHPQAPPAGDRKSGGPRCGGCLLLERNGWGFLKCTRGRSGEIGTPSFRCGPYESHGAATDVRAWWPGCEHWQARSEGAGHDH
jgi:hypothetical protein